MYRFQKDEPINLNNRKRRTLNEDEETNNCLSEWDSKDEPINSNKRKKSTLIEDEETNNSLSELDSSASMEFN